MVKHRLFSFTEFYTKDSSILEIKEITKKASKLRTKMLKWINKNNIKVISIQEDSHIEKGLFIFALSVYYDDLK